MDWKILRCKSEISDVGNFYLTDISGLNVSQSNAFRRLLFSKEISVSIVKNTLLRKAFEKNEVDFEELYDTLKGNTAIIFTEKASDPAKLIKDFRKKHDKPILKAAFLDNSFYLGDDKLEFLSNLKSKEELLGDIIGLLQSPIQSLLSGINTKNKLGSIVAAIKEAAPNQNSLADGQTEVKKETVVDETPAVEETPAVDGKDDNEDEKNVT